jgi:two-component system CheB/CheR fusion protein
VPTFYTDGEFTGYTGTCTEIHDQRLISEELEHRVYERTPALEEATTTWSAPTTNYSSLLM